MREDILQTYRTIMSNNIRDDGFIKPSIPLEDQEPIDVDKTQLITYTLKIRPGGSNDHTYKKALKIFSDGSATEWIDAMKDIEIMWTQNSVNGPQDRAAIIKTVLADEPLAHFENALEELRVGPDGERLAFDNNLVKKALDEAAKLVFPHRALEHQKSWMSRIMQKPYNMPYRIFQNRVIKMNKYLPMFPGGDESSSFTEKQLVEILEFGLPKKWKKQFNARHYIPTQHSKKRLLMEVEALERNEEDKKEKPEKRGKTTMKKVKEILVIIE